MAKNLNLHSGSVPHMTKKLESMGANETNPAPLSPFPFITITLQPMSGYETNPARSLRLFISTTLQPMSGYETNPAISLRFITTTSQLMSGYETNPARSLKHSTLITFERLVTITVKFVRVVKFIEISLVVMKLFLTLTKLFCLFRVLAAVQANPNRMSTPAASGNKPNFKAPTKLLENDFFYYGKGMQAKFIKSEKRMLDNVGKTYGPGTLASLKEGIIEAVKIAKPAQHTETAFKALAFFEQTLWKSEMDSYANELKQTRTSIKRVYHLLWSHTHDLLRDQIKLDPIYTSMTMESDLCKQNNATTLYAIMKRLCNGATVIESPKRTMLESLFNLLFIRGDDYISLQDYTDVFDQHAMLLPSCVIYA